MITLFDRIFATRPASEWRELLLPAGVTHSIVAQAADAVSDEQMLAAGVLTPLQGVPGAPLTINSPLWLADEPKRPAGPPPGLGEHNDALLNDP